VPKYYYCNNDTCGYKDTIDDDDDDDDDDDNDDKDDKDNALNDETVITPSMALLSF
jgi:hypothetical protein